MHLLKKVSSNGSAYQQIDIKGVKDDVLILPNNRYRSIIQTSAINFELKSESERDALIDSYQSFLNSLDYPIQLVIRVREVDLDEYFSLLDARAEKERIVIYRHQLKSYADFLKGLVNVNRILSRSFYVVIALDSDAKHDFDFAKDQLAFRSDLVAKGLQRLGMHTTQLDSLAILNLFYSYYNPAQSKLQPLSDSALKMMHFALKGEAL